MELWQSVRSGKMDPMQYLLVSRELARQEREEERYQWEREQRGKTPPITPESLEKMVTDAVAAAMPRAPASEEPPQWAKNIQKLLDRLEKEDEEKRLKRIVEEATVPYETKLEQERAERKKLEEQLNERKEKEAREYIEAEVKKKVAEMLPDIPAEKRGTFIDEAAKTVGEVYANRMRTDLERFVTSTAPAPAVTPEGKPDYWGEVIRTKDQLFTFLDKIAERYPREGEVPPKKEVTVIPPPPSPPTLPAAAPTEGAPSVVEPKPEETIKSGGTDVGEKPAEPSKVAESKPAGGKTGTEPSGEEA